jgi:signal transduction histidine kinase
MTVESVASQERRRVVAYFDWEAFRSEDRYLDQVQCEWSEFEVTPEMPSGTVLTLSQLRDAWDGPSFRNLRIQLSRLMANPTEDDQFEIVLHLPSEFQAFAGPVTPPPVLSRPHYSMYGKVEENGEIEATLSIGEESRPIRQKLSLEGGRSPSCGPFLFEFKVWDRDREHLKSLALDLGSTLPNIRKDLNAAAGVSVYRDRFRVLRYGDETDDWLRLDLRRVQNPTLRISNNQIVGSIYITADKNPELRDQTNREGIVDSPALVDLRDSVGELLGYIELARYDLRRDTKKLDRQQSLFDELNLTSVRAAFEERYPDDKEFLNVLTDKDVRVKKSVEHIQEVLSRYRRLSTLGQIIDVVLHDGRTPVSSISSQCALARRSLNKSLISDELRAVLSHKFEIIDSQAKLLSSLFGRISPFSGGKRGKPVELVLESVIQDTLAIFHERIEESGVDVVLPESRTVVKGDATDLRQIFLNLIDNSLHWLSRSQGTKTIEIVVNRHETEVEVLFSDSGPGVPKEIQDMIFDPYFSSRPEGIGIGLTIAGEIVAEYGGALELVEPGLLKGANFRFTLKLDA